MRTASITRSPSFSFGMNSPPRFKATGTLAATRPERQPGRDDRHRRITMSSAGVKTCLSSRTSQTSFSWTFEPRPIETSTGIKVSERIIEPNRAKITVRAIGRNSFPSVPCKARIGR